MKYTIAEFNKQFPDEVACLDEMFKRRYGHLIKCPKCSKRAAFHRAKNRKVYACQFCGYQLSPLAGTIFHKSSTPLKLWFHAIFLFSTSKNGVAAKELQRQLGVTYKTAWRMAAQIRKLMGQDDEPLAGEVEIDETFYGKGGTHQTKFKNKHAIIGMVERKGKIKAKQLPNRQAALILPVIKEAVVRGSRVITDEYRGYDKLSYSAYGYQHHNVKHGKGHYSWKGQNTNTIEGFWGQLKTSLRGTYHFVSPQHLQSYIDEFAWRYNNREGISPAFVALLARVSQVAQLG
ncbi:MAG: IS1595 family transposase [Patescibacteria group bacterium]|nr:IS1595 family transposase [Patescibacteria group bacterium]MDE1945504.1 IS1595 family transposase [Patescibacteria group bacterium]MDE2057624.1 IS1595 family transposase [Patescibacteria group bacterium]